MEDNVSQFIKAYNDLDEALRKYYKDNSRNYSYISRYANQLRDSNDNDLSARGEKLDMIRVLRNNLVHELDMNSNELIIINDETINFLNQEIELFQNPLLAKDICVKKDKIVFASLDQDLYTLFSKMFAFGFTQLPVLKEDGSLYGVFSPNCLYNYMVKNKGDISQNIKLYELQHFLPLENHLSEKYIFVSEYVEVKDIIDIFDDYYRKGKKLQMAFVTKGGRKDGELIGIIVSNDLIKVRR